MTETQVSGRELRLLFEKSGPIRFISHLDLTRTFHRAFLRAGIPFQFSLGFSPHPKFSFALPLSVGTESLAELADFTIQATCPLSDGEILHALQEQMPAGIVLKHIGEQKEKFSAIAFASYEVTLPLADPKAIFQVESLLKEPLIIKKKNKKGKWVEKDIGKGIHSVSFRERDGGVLMTAKLCASGENYLKPESVLTALQEALPEWNTKEKRILRTGIFREDGSAFE